MGLKELSWKHVALIGIGVVAVLGVLWELNAWHEEREARAMMAQIQNKMIAREKAFDEERADNEKEMAQKAQTIETMQERFHDSFEKSWNEAHKIMEDLDKRYQR